MLLIIQTIIVILAIIYKKPFKNYIKIKFNLAFGNLNIIKKFYYQIYWKKQSINSFISNINNNKTLYKIAKIFIKFKIKIKLNYFLIYKFWDIFNNKVFIIYLSYYKIINKYKIIMKLFYIYLILII